MANTYTAVSTPVTATTISVSSFGSKVTDDLDYLAVSKPNCRVYNSATISHTTSGVYQALTFNSERYDKGAGSHSTVSNTGRLTVPTGCAGVYRIFGCITFAANATGARGIAIRLNGTTYLVAHTTAAFASVDCSMAITTNYSLAVGDYVELMGFQSSGAALNMSLNGNIAPEFGWEWVST